MKTEYRKLGDLVDLIDERNKSLVSTEVLGISIDKEFMPSVANTIGTDLSNYKLLKKNRFACNPMHVGRDERLPVSLYNKEIPAIVSPAYFMFEIADTKSVLPEYLMLNFKRADFDRNCWFRTDGSVRGGITWEALCEIELPIPAIEVQQKIVDAYNAITKRIQIKQKINEKLEKTAISILNEKIGQTVFSNSTEKEIEEKKNSLPQGWKLITISEYCSRMESGSTPSRTENEYWTNGNIPWLKSGEVHNNITFETEEYITEKGLKESSTKLLPVDTVLMAMYGVTAGEVGYLNIPATTNQAICGMICKNKIEAAYLYFALIQNQKMISQMSNGGAQNNLSKAFIESMYIVVPKEDILQKLKINVVLQHFILTSKEIKCLNKSKQLIVSKISKR